MSNFFSSFHNLPCSNYGCNTRELRVRSVFHAQYTRSSSKKADGVVKDKHNRIKSLKAEISTLLLMLILCSIYVSSFALSNDEINFLVDKEQFGLLEKHADALLNRAYSGSQEDVLTVLNYAIRADQPGLAVLCNKRLATEFKSLDAALQWLMLTQAAEVDSTTWLAEVQEIIAAFPVALDKSVLSYYAGQATEEDISVAIALADKYNDVIETMAKEIIDEISTQRSDSLALAMIDQLHTGFPYSKYDQIAYYYQLYHLSNAKNWEAFKIASDNLAQKSPVHAYISAIYLISPGYRKAYKGEQDPLLKAEQLLQQAASTEAQTLLYDNYSPADWKNRISLQQAKIDYYQLLQKYGMFGDEKPLSSLKKLPMRDFNAIKMKLLRISFANNDRGEYSEKFFWLGKLYSLNPKTQKEAAKSFAECLRWGSPRKKYDIEAWDAITAIHAALKIKQAPMDWIRSIFGYKGIVFQDVSQQAGVEGIPYSRVALGDYNSDGMIDMLFSGKHLYTNLGGMEFNNDSSVANLDSLSSTGGLFADFNKDGKLDILSLSYAENGMGERLMKNQDLQRFVSVNERAGDIDDKSPTEAAAWVDMDGKGYPSIYVTNYEKWQKRAGYPDYFWNNAGGYFSDKSQAYGFRTPDYTDNPGQAGRGVAPADFDNDGKQEIFVSNYRLNRNFCWKQTDTLFVDVAPLYGLAGTYKKGYYGHSIGADWGDYDNDGDLDVFIANLAHPRFLDISDISMLLRNDGLASRVVEGDTLYYWQFTDVTANAGITYDELHSDPCFFDADNDGYLDLFISSVYENDRSYLYHNNGDSTFSDITWLAGARVYNGWGNACGDLDRDGKLDLVVGSGNGAKVLRNNTKTTNKAVYVKPVWVGEKIQLISDPAQFGKVPQSPAFGSRVVLSYKLGGKTHELVRELSSAKGTASQNAAELQFGIGKGKLLEIRRYEP